MRKFKFNTIRMKILVVFSAAFFLLLLMLSISSSFFLEDYYIQTNKNRMIDGVEFFLNESVKNDIQSTSELIRELEKGIGAEMEIFDSNNNALLSRATATNRPVLAPRQIQNIRDTVEFHDRKAQFIIIDGLESTEDSSLVTQKMIAFSYFGDGQIFAIVKRMGMVNEMKTMFSAFLVRASVIIYIIGCGVIFLISGFFSRPIIEIKNTTKKMSQLDFSQKLSVNSMDEVGELKQSVNEMAVQLSESITALNETNLKLEEELEKERTLEKMRRRFVSDVSHELKNPLSMILGYADGLVQKIPKTEKEKQDYYSIIIDETNRMNKLVNDLLDLSAYESGTYRLEYEKFDVDELIDNALERFSYNQDEKMIHIDYNRNQRCEIFADRLRVGQIITNILGNAFKHVDDGGNIKITERQDQKHYYLTIANTGRLIPKQELDKIWHSFYQVDTEIAGNGLGLAIVKSIVKLHGGQCSAYVENGYNCFEVVLKTEERYE